MFSHRSYRKAVVTPIYKDPEVPETGLSHLLEHYQKCLKNYLLQAQ